MGDSVKVALIRKGREIHRKFSNDIVKTSFGKALMSLGKKYYRAFETAFPEMGSNLASILSPTSDYFTQAQNLPWYLDLIGKRFFDEPEQKYRILVKSCEGFLFVRLFVYEAKSNAMVLRPFFHEATLPSSLNDTEKVRGLADVLLLLAPKLEQQLSRRRDIDLRDLFDWSQIDIRATICGKRTAKNVLDVSLSPKVKLFTRDLDPRKKFIFIKPSGRNEEQPVLVASRNTRKAIANLAEVWQNPDAKSVLLCAAPGSGKEVLKDILLYATEIPHSCIFQYSAPVLASSQDPLAVLLNEIDSKPNLVDHNSRQLSSRTILFLDEIHHPDVQRLRSILLRCMEEDRIQVPGKLFIDSGRLMYVFAASEHIKKLRDLAPPDFWTRVEYNIIMHHALRLDCRKERQKVLRQIFTLFWRKAARSRPDADPAVKKELLRNSAVESLADEFAAELSSLLIQIISIRMLRSLIYRLYGRAVYLWRTAHIPIENLATEISRRRLELWISELWREIVPEQASNIF